MGEKCLITHYYSMIFWLLSIVRLRLCHLFYGGPDFDNSSIKAEAGAFLLVLQRMVFILGSVSAGSLSNQLENLHCGPAEVKLYCTHM